MAWRIAADARNRVLMKHLGPSWTPYSSLMQFGFAIPDLVIFRKNEYGSIHITTNLDQSCQRISARKECIR